MSECDHIVGMHSEGFMSDRSPVYESEMMEQTPLTRQFFLSPDNNGMEFAYCPLCSKKLAHSKATDVQTDKQEPIP